MTKTAVVMPVAGTADARYEGLKSMLEERRREILDEVQGRMRHVRAEGEGAITRGVIDLGERTSNHIEDDVEFEILQMKSETLHKIEEALGRLENGTYGYCFECGSEVAERRLRALPFAVRCRECEEARQVVATQERARSQRRSTPLFLDMSS